MRLVAFASDKGRAEGRAQSDPATLSYKQQTPRGRIFHVVCSDRGVVCVLGMQPSFSQSVEIGQQL